MRLTSRARSLALLAVFALALPSAAALSRGMAHETATGRASGTAPAQDAPAAAPVPETEIAAARAGLVTRLVDLAGWCKKVELFEESDKVWEQVLVLDPKNLDAHKGLQHARSADGSWHETKRHVYKNRSTKSLPELPQKRAEAMKPFSERMVALARTAPDTATRNTYLAAVLALDPDDPTVHAYQGDVKDGEHWVLPETSRAREQRARIKALVKGALEGAPQTTTELPIDSDPMPAFGWRFGVTTGFVRVLTSGAEDEAKTLARACTAAGTVVQTLFGKEAVFPQKYTFYLVEPAQKDVLLATLTGFDDEDRARIAKLEGTGLPRRQDVALWTGDKARTLDQALRHTLSKLLNRGVGLTPSCGWVWEGFGLYLTREITGTRLTWFVGAGPTEAGSTGAKLQARLLSQDANWMNEAMTLLGGADAPQLAEVMKRDLGHLEVRDVVAGYALAAFLIESQPDTVAAFVKRATAGEDPETTTQAILNMSTDQLRQRLVRWLSERK